MATVERVEARLSRLTAPPFGRRVLSWVLAPWWALQVFSGRKTFVGNPILGSAVLNRRGLHVWRARLAGRLSERRRRRLAGGVSAQDRAAFARDGFVARPQVLDATLFARLRDEVAAYQAPAYEFREGDAVTRRIPLTPDALRRLPACAALLRQPAWRGLTRYVSSFDAAPAAYIQTVFAGAAAAGTDPQTALHMDTFHSVMKAWLYLDDITGRGRPPALRAGHPPAHAPARGVGAGAQRPGLHHRGQGRRVPHLGG